MKILNAQLQAHLNSGTTTLCSCWRLTLRTGEKIGFTDHDRPVAFDGTSFEAQTGFTATEIQSTLDLAVDNLEASGALRSDQLDATRLGAGDYDHAAIEIWLVNWQDPTQRSLQRKGHLGEVTYGQGHFKAEVRGLAHLLNQQKGRLFQFGCDATLGDSRCGVALSSSAFHTAAMITKTYDSSFEISGAGGFADDWFSRGTLNFTSGANNGRSFAVKRHRALTNTTRIDLWQALKLPAVVGDQIILQAGCDKQFATCKTKFANSQNFRGFPQMPGNDFVLGVASSTDAKNNGGSRTI